MKRLLIIITVIFVTLATVATCPGKETQDKNNPFGPLIVKKLPERFEIAKKPESTKVEAKNDISSDPERQDPIITEVFNLNFANAEDAEKTISKLVSRDGRVS